MGGSKIFDPQPLFQDFRTDAEKTNPRPGDRRDGKIYDYPESLVLAINVALATARPLLLRGTAGCGKSSVAYNIARVMKRCYFEKVVESRMEARDLLWRFDAVRRLGDAQASSAAGATGKGAWNSRYPYIEPEVLWWVFDEESANRRGAPAGTKLKIEAPKHQAVYRPTEATPLRQAVILLDEIDKAEPDVPNNLLVALGSMQFRVDEIQELVKFGGTREPDLAAEEMPLLIITTNEERQLPPAFLRRCVVYRFEPLDSKRLQEIAERSEGKDDSGLHGIVADKMIELASEEAGGSGRKPEVSIAEYMDALRAAKRLGESKKSDRLIEIIKRTTWKGPARD